MSTLPRIAFLGTGLMGDPMSRRLLKAGYPLAAWNRTRDKAEALAAAGAAVADSPADAVRDADVVITMLTRGDTVADVLFAQGAAAAMRPGTVVIDMSSIRPDEARDHADRLKAMGIDHLDAPVSGGTVGAAEGTLSIMAGGDPDLFERLRPVFTAMGRPTLIGPSGSGQIAKLANQAIVATTIGAVAEALVFAERAGADPAKVRDALRGGFADSRILDLHGGRMIARTFQPGGRTSSQIKDLENAAAAAASVGADMPFATLAMGLFRDLLAHAGDVDHSGLWIEIDRRSREG
ncbi:NAD(P)-dependent oxidoreductase [Chthonobacter albigriseus]|uniref:NAD(P)-dependent oxidoreductase n=1 Tax=Chthonobacter albigriseus TaxID=1683161 RepID=UPI0015EF7265|nr:NAD(P)-dependent oxidoreductase [Chthonobacter albigriseus]